LAGKWEERERTSGTNPGDKAPIFLGFSKLKFFKRKAYVTPFQCGSHIASLLKIRIKPQLLFGIFIESGLMGKTGILERVGPCRAIL
jgi:hypothetical protein